MSVYEHESNLATYVFCVTWLEISVICVFYIQTAYMTERIAGYWMFFMVINKLYVRIKCLMRHLSGIWCPKTLIHARGHIPHFPLWSFMHGPHVACCATIQPSHPLPFWSRDSVLFLSSPSVSCVAFCLVILMLVVVFYRKDPLCCKFRPYRTEHYTVRTAINCSNHREASGFSHVNYDPFTLL